MHLMNSYIRHSGNFQEWITCFDMFGISSATTDFLRLSLLQCIHINSYRPIDSSRCSGVLLCACLLTGLANIEHSP